MQPIKNTRINLISPLISPALLIKEVEADQAVCQHVLAAREGVQAALNAEQDRLVVVIGPCSIHDPVAAMEYAQRLQPLCERYQQSLCIIMRVYFEKPRTTIGWKGLINDPTLDDSFDINRGLRTSRQLLLDINRLGVPTGSEFLDTMVPQYISDLVSWAAIGARTVESQVHRQLASGLSMPVGFKNSTTGNIQVAIDAILAAAQPQHFLSVTNQGLGAIVSTQGNDACHVILRGSSDGPNYSAEIIQQTVGRLQEQALAPRLMVDCSHGNSAKDYRRQMVVLDSLCEQIKQGEEGIFGLMIESNLVEGQQKINKAEPLVYGQSVTDACVGWQETLEMLAKLDEAVCLRRAVKEGK